MTRKRKQMEKNYFQLKRQKRNNSELGICKWKKMLPLQPIV